MGVSSSTSSRDSAASVSAVRGLDALVTVKWGDSVVATKHVAEGAEATVGASVDTMLPIPCEPLGVPAVTVATVRGGAPIAFVPAAAVGFLERAGAVPSPVGGPAEVRLGVGETLSFAIGRFLVTVTAEAASKVPWTALAPLRTSLSPLRYVAVAALAHAFVIGLSAQAAHAQSFEDNGPDTEALQRYLAAADERSATPEKVTSSSGEGEMGKDVNDKEGNGKDGGGARAAGKEGAMGSAASRSNTPSRFAVSGKNQDAPRATATKDEVLEQARSFGMASLLADAAHAPARTFGDAAASADVFAANGAMWATSVGESFGAGGLGLSGIGEGGGGRADGSVGLGEIGTLGHTFGRPGLGTGGAGLMSLGIGGGSWGGSYVCGEPAGRLGHGRGTSAGVGYRTPDAYDLNPPAFDAGVRPAKAEEVNEARLPAETIRRVVRLADGRFRMCYQAELMSNPTLRGGITTRFLIGADGGVKSAANLGTDLPASLVSCVTRVFSSLTFPEPPEGRPVTVMYPLTFSPVANTTPKVTVER